MACIASSLVSLLYIVYDSSSGSSTGPENKGAKQLRDYPDVSKHALFKSDVQNSLNKLFDRFPIRDAEFKDGPPRDHPSWNLDWELSMDIISDRSWCSGNVLGIYIIMHAH